MDDQVTYRQQVNFCGKPRCRKCRDGIGHGPYWYAYRLTADGRKERVYIGKNLPTDAMGQGVNQSGQDSQGDREGRPYHTTEPPTGPVYDRGEDNQGGGKPRPYPTTEPPTDPVYGTGDPRGRPGDAAPLNPAVEAYSEIDA